MRMLFALIVAASFVAQEPQVYTPGNGVTVPRVTTEVRPDYTNEAKSQRIEGTVLLDAVVKADGAVGDVKVTRSLDSVYGLDANAIKAMKLWQFAPGMKDGKAVDVRIAVEMTFTLK